MKLIRQISCTNCNHSTQAYWKKSRKHNIKLGAKCETRFYPYCTALTSMPAIFKTNISTKWLKWKKLGLLTAKKYNQFSLHSKSDVLQAFRCAMEKDIQWLVKMQMTYLYEAILLSRLEMLQYSWRYMQNALWQFLTAVAYLDKTCALYIRLFWLFQLQFKL